MTQDSIKEETKKPEPEPCFWESELYFKQYFRDRRNKEFQYYDDSSIFRYLFFSWANNWVILLTKNYVDPYRLHPLPVSDQVLKWIPIFSKHVSDGLFEMESRLRFNAKGKVKARSNKSIMLRALFLTIWKRGLWLIIGLIAVNILSMSIAILVKKLLELLNDKLLCIIHYLTSISIFEHGLSHRRRFSNNINGSNSLNVCNQVLHSCSPDSECSKNPLFCPALRYQSKGINAQMYAFEWNDCYNVSELFDSIKYLIEFLCTFFYGIFLLSYQLKLKLWVLYIIGICFVFAMIIVEILNAYLYSKCDNIFSHLNVIKKTFYDDIGINVIIQSRNTEISLFFLRFFLTLFNMTLFITCTNLSFYVIQSHFVKSVNAASVITDIDTAGFMTTFYIFLRIITSMFLVPTAIKVFGMSYVSFKRMDKYFKTCSPNFYITGNPYTGSTKTATVIADTTNQIPNDVVVYFKDATFTWVNTRDDLLNKNYEPYLKNINFELKRGEIAIVTGSKGSGKSNFLKSILGEMTLVGGSMAVVPLYTSMPIFYASEDIFLQHGTVRSNIVFGHKFDEQLYNTVLKAVELEYDISTWKKGDLRVLSDNALSLSGGQRVRMELARAVYAYLVFHRVNKEYNNSQCSFLMCLDFSLHGLDPYVSKTVFNNLFNLKTGLLVNGDLSVVLTTSKQSLQLCAKISDLTQLPNVPIYNVKKNTLQFTSNLHEFIAKKDTINHDFKYLSSINNDTYRINYLTNDIISLCTSSSRTRLGRREETKAKYYKSFQSFVQNDLSGAKLRPYIVFLKGAPLAFSLYALTTVAFNVMDNLKLVLATNLSDHITKNIDQFNNGHFVNLSEIKTLSNSSLNKTTIFVSSIITISFLSTVFFSISTTTSCRKIHEYLIDSVFKNSSSLIRIKKQINQLITCISCDMYSVDEEVGYFLSLCFVYSIQLLISILTLFYLFPVSIPLVIPALVTVYYYVLRRQIQSSKYIHFAYIESVSNLMAVYENSISGSSIYRSFTRQSDLVNKVLEHRDYKARCKCLLYTVVVWSSVLFNWIFSLTTFLILLALIVLDKVDSQKLKVGYFGLALSLNMNVIKYFDKLALMYSKLEIAVCSVQRLQYFVPPGEKVTYSKFINTHEEYLVNPINKEVCGLDKKQLLKRRAIEFKTDNKKFYALRRLFYHPKLHILDVNDYLTHDRTGVQLNDVCVYTTAELNPESMILKHVSVSAGKSEIIGMVGRTGAGKTTLLSVLQNIVSNRTGQVLLDGKDLNDIPKVVLRQIIGVLPQLPFVFKGWTVRRFVDPRRLFTDTDINDALDKCGLLHFVNELQGGKKLDTVLVHENLGISRRGPNSVNQPKVNGSDRICTSSELDSFDGLGKYRESTRNRYESDTLLSNTQLRTLSLARLVLYRNFFRMIVVDEPPEEDLAEETSSRCDDLGVPIYDLLIKYFCHCTTFVTAHDANVLKICSSIWVVHDGCLIRTCKTSDIQANDSIASIIENSVKYTK
ncbi:uncharacterized protein TOT_030000644 [Theileria orientalis strain Shintoku]|uniref:ABC transporter n=1 Tax=Theileria orientalis strain Shintoku TaxID=869250 RepID=J4CDM1_THEOR|nr:uncharacterized protein TOT_030000644 [Theileria orientalis strain Shintoku]BAM41382.1 uncharacterized protein TOT_030000644 [Theileria orientalis strain Shintoku]|eukprot:XP_009691683.1 uncharacterized protein TOT_030000644 [Theileria orientalis strain Shintoku]